MSGSDLDLGDARFDVVWLRRPTLPILPSEDDIHPGDRLIAWRESKVFQNSLWHFVGPDSFWVNPPQARAYANSKPVQLREAVAAGLRVPKTLFSNDPDRIKAFIRDNAGQVIFKPFVPAQWQMEHGLAMLFTSEVSLEDLPDDDILQLTPGIFQRKISKSYELRITCIGGELLAVKLHSQAQAVSQLDWKAAFADLPVERITVSPELEAACHRLMKRLGIVFGCMDFVVTPEGELVFLEVNEMGQFLWLEGFCPDLPILDAFTEFLIHGRADFRWQPRDTSIRFEDIKTEALAVMKADAALHVAKPDNISVRDELQALESGSNPSFRCSHGEHQHG